LCDEFSLWTTAAPTARWSSAPRPHNSGHYTAGLATYHQFDLQVHAMAGLRCPRHISTQSHPCSIYGDMWFDAAGQAHTDWQTAGVPARICTCTAMG
jgi:hypothetical protein